MLSMQDKSTGSLHTPLTLDDLPGKRCPCNRGSDQLFLVNTAENSGL